MDILSSLPDDVICHILSFLPTKRSVQTSVLSKRWSFLWAYVPFLEFSFDDTNTVNMITQILLQHNHDIHTFRLTIGDLYGIEEEFESWIANITRRKILSLFIELYNFQFNLPRCLFACNSLVDLWLEACGNIPTGGIYFPALKKLKLVSVEYESDKSLSHLISGCPVLEELIIEETVLGQCCVSSATLTRLDIRLYCYDKFVNFGLKLDTPKLMYLWLDCCMPLSDKFSVGPLDSLIEANIDLYWDERYQEKSDYSRCVLALVSKLYNVKHLTLLNQEIDVVHDSAFSAVAIKFHNLTKLSLFSCLSVIKCFLENANNLQVLHLKIHSGVDIDHQYWVDPKQVPTCLVSRLLTVTVSDFGCFEHEFDAVKYILMNAKVLKSMKIIIRDINLDWEKKFKILKRVSLFKRGSQECKLAFD